jgi:PilZ domain
MAAPATPLAAGEQVLVSLPLVGTLPATVEGVSGTEVTVVLAVADDRVTRLAGREAALERTTSRGVDRFTGPMRLAGPSGETLAIAVTGEAQRVQRRDWARIEAVVPVVVTPLEKSATGGETMTRNVSGGGLLIVDPWRLVIGTDVRVAVSLAAEEVVRALCRVARDAGEGQTGLRIEDMPREDEERLIRFIRERERVALRLARGRA